MDVLHVVGARPNFMKAAPLLLALDRLSNIQQTLVHTGQHYDRKLSEIFFRELRCPHPTSIWKWDRVLTAIRRRRS